MLSNIGKSGAVLSFTPRSRTSLAAFVALELLSHDQWHHAGESWQTCVLQPRCVIIDPNGKLAIVVACQVYAARIWRLHRNGDLMLLDPSLPMEWVVATDITAWSVVPWEPIVALDRDASQARYGCVTFKQSRPAVSALAWAVANHRLHKQQLKRFARDRDVHGAEELLAELLEGHADHAFYMALFRRGKPTEDPPADLVEMTKACLVNLDPQNLSAFGKEKDQLLGPQLGDDVAVGSDDEEPPVEHLDHTMGAVQEELDTGVDRPDGANGDIQPHECVESAELGEGAGLGPPILALEAPGEGRRDRTCPSRSQGVRATATHSNVDWATGWLPPPPPAATKFGVTRIVASKKWTTFYDHPGAGSPPEGHFQ